MDLNATQVIDINSEEEDLEEEDGKRKVAELRVFKHKEAEEIYFSVYAGRNLIGRDTRCDICIPVQAISKKHACIETSGSQFLLYDFASRNKTRRGKLMLQAGVRYELKDGDEITFADVKSQFYKVEEDLNDTADLSGSETGSESMLPDEVDTGDRPRYCADGTDSGHNGSQEDELDVAQSVLLMPTQKYLEENNSETELNNGETDCPTLVADTDSETDIEDNALPYCAGTPQTDENSPFLIKQTPGYLLKESHRLCVNDSDQEQSPVPPDNAPSLIAAHEAKSRVDSPSQVPSTLVLGSCETTPEKTAHSNASKERNSSHAKAEKTDKTFKNSLAVKDPLLESDDETEDLKRIDYALLSPAIVCKSKKENNNWTRDSLHYGPGKVKFDALLANTNIKGNTAAISVKCSQEVVPDSEDIDELDSTQAYGVDRFSLFHAITLAQDHSTSDTGDSDQKGSVSLTTIPPGDTNALLGTVSSSESLGRHPKVASSIESSKDHVDGMADTVAVTESTLKVVGSHRVTGLSGLDANMTAYNTADSAAIGDTMAIMDTAAAPDTLAMPCQVRENHTVVSPETGVSATLTIADTASIQDTVTVTDTELIDSAVPFISSPIDTSLSVALNVLDSGQVAVPKDSVQGQKSPVQVSVIEALGVEDASGDNMKGGTRFEYQLHHHSTEKQDHIADPIELDHQDAFSTEATQVYSYEIEDLNLALEASSRDPVNQDSLHSQNMPRNEMTLEGQVVVPSKDAFPSCRLNVNDGKNEMEIEATQAYGVEDDDLMQTEETVLQLPVVPQSSGTQHKVEIKSLLLPTDETEAREKSFDSFDDDVDATQAYSLDEVDYGEDVVAHAKHPAPVRSVDDRSEEGRADKLNFVSQKREVTVLTPEHVDEKGEAEDFETEATQAYSLDDFEMPETDGKEMKVDFSAEIKTTALEEERDKDIHAHSDPSCRTLEERVVSEMAGSEKCHRTGKTAKAGALSSGSTGCVSPRCGDIQAKSTEENAGGGKDTEEITFDSGEGRKNRAGISPVVAVDGTKVTTRPKRGKTQRSKKGKEAGVRNYSTQHEVSKPAKDMKQMLVEMRTPDRTESESTDSESILRNSRRRVGSGSSRRMRTSKVEPKESERTVTEQVEIIEKKGLPVDRSDETKCSPLKTRRSNRSSARKANDKKQELETAENAEGKDKERENARSVEDDNQELQSAETAKGEGRELENARSVEDDNQELQSAETTKGEGKELENARSVEDDNPEQESTETTKGEDGELESVETAKGKHKDSKGERSVKSDNLELESERMVKDQGKDLESAEAAKDKDQEFENEQSCGVNRVLRRKATGNDPPNKGAPASTITSIRVRERRSSIRRNAGKRNTQGKEAANDIVCESPSSRGMSSENVSNYQSILTCEDGQKNSERIPHEERDETEDERMPLVSVEETIEIDNASNSFGQIDTERAVEHSINCGGNKADQVYAEEEVASLSKKKATRKRGRSSTKADKDATNADNNTASADVITEDRQETLSCNEPLTKRNVVGPVLRQLEKTAVSEIQPEPVLLKIDKDASKTTNMSGRNQELVKRVPQVKKDTVTVKKSERRRARSGKQRKVEELEAPCSHQSLTGDSPVTETENAEEQQADSTEGESSSFAKTPKAGDADFASTPAKNIGRKRGRTRSHANCDVEDKNSLPAVLNKKRRAGSSTSSKEGDDRGKEVEAKRNPSLSRSPSLRAASSRQIPKVLFTGLTDHHMEKVAKDLGAELVDSVHEATHLVTDKVRRTVKFLCCLGRGIPVVNITWLTSSKQAGTFLPTPQYIVEDKIAEKQYLFSLKRSIAKAAELPLLSGYEVYVSRHVKPEPKQMKDIIECAGGKFLTRLPAKLRDDTPSFVIASEEDKKEITDAQKLGLPLYTNELLLTGILSQELNFDAHLLGAAKSSEAEKSAESSSGSRKEKIKFSAFEPCK